LVFANKHLPFHAQLSLPTNHEPQCTSVAQVNGPNTKLAVIVNTVMAVIINTVSDKLCVMDELYCIISADYMTVVFVLDAANYCLLITPLGLLLLVG